MNKIAKKIGELEKPNFPFRPDKIFYKEIQIGHKRFWAIFKDKSEPSLEEVKKIAKYFHFNPNDLIDLNYDMQSQAKAVENPKQIKIV